MTLLAKSHLPERPELSLEQHCFDTEQAAAAIFRPDGRWARAWARFFQLDDSDQQRAWLELRIAALFHDIGKANAEFQTRMSGTKRVDGAQTVRHEHFSALVLVLPEVRCWLETNPTIDVDVITAAVLSHHVKASSQGDFSWCAPRSTRPFVELALQDPQITAIFERVRELAELPPLPQLPPSAWSHDKAPWADALVAGRSHAKDFARALRRDRARNSRLLAVKAGVIVADTVASGVFRVGGTLDRWIEDVVHIGPLSGDDIAHKIINPRTRQISSWTGEPFVFHRFQTLASEQGRRALLVAGCGTGKTLAAWKWAERRAREESIGRVIFLYPTRGTATEGFRDYVGWAPPDEATLLHGTATYELDAMRENPPESMKNKQPLPDESMARLYALQHWPRRFFSATVDQFLGFMEHSYTGLCLLPALADSAVIFDEIHSYDRRMFSTLLAFLERFDVPALCMTATLPPDRRRQLAARGLSIFPDNSHRSDLADLEHQELRPRYRVEHVDNQAQAIERAIAAYHAGQRVLWVVNTVARCQEIADSLSKRSPVDPLVYHSRFRLCDRKHAHERVVGAFRPGRGPIIAVTTQVCEMSLDLDADVLITEVAPVTSLVQRVGRANRSLSRPDTDRAHVLWYSPPGAKPYPPAELAAGRAMLDALEVAELSQRGLAEALERHAPRGPEARPRSPFVSSGYYATPGSLREENDYTVPAVLDQDLDELLELARTRRPFDGLLLPVPKRHGHVPDPRPGDLPRYLQIAHGQYYSQSHGFVAPGSI